jgi:hypothetical protein
VVWRLDVVVASSPSSEAGRSIEMEGRMHGVYWRLVR